MSRNEKNGKWFAAMAAAISCLAFSLSPAGAVTWQEKAKLHVPDVNAAGASFGSSVSISGDHAIVGTDLYFAMGSDPGSAYVFKRDGTNWGQPQKLTASDGAYLDHFGYSVSISGDYAIVGAYGNNNRGAAYIFDCNVTGWSQQAKITDSNGTIEDWFGFSVSISGDYAIVGASESYRGGAGSASVFKRNGASWSRQQKFTASDGAKGEAFGYSVSICGDYAIVGAVNDDHKGSAYIFLRSGTSWVQQQKLTASDGAAYDEFGISVSISGDYAIVGTPGDDDNGSASGSAYIFKRNGTSWSQQAKLIAPDGGEVDQFGISVSISGDCAMVGAYGYNNHNYRGAAYIFKREGTNWAQQQKLLALDGANGDVFGWSASISSNHAIVGAYGDDDNGTNSGSAYVFMWCSNADLSGDCSVNFVDFAVLASQWTQSPGVPSADIAPLPNGDGIVNLLDLALFADWWLYGTN